ncbi:hypothetical protein [Allochromatium tepidum]|uniref:hypothetical protein n=1 Tax=Allochromatium tepidum TaxID=553982 RepID=UPI001BCD41FF|nr:hypothetical protein [Allochromatium tepidum]
MSKWIRNQTSEVEKVTFYVNTESDPRIAEWIRSIPYGKTGEHIRAAIDFFLEHGQVVVQEKKSRRRKQVTVRPAPPPPVHVTRNPVSNSAIVDSTQNPTDVAVDYRKIENPSATPAPNPTPEPVPMPIPASPPAPIAAPVSTPKAADAVPLPSPLPAPDPASVNEQDFDSLDDVDPQALALQKELASRFF